MSFASEPRTKPDSVIAVAADTGNDTSRRLAARIAVRPEFDHAFDHAFNHVFDIVMPPLKMPLPFAAELLPRWNSRGAGGRDRAVASHLDRCDSAQIAANWTVPGISRTVAHERNRAGARTEQQRAIAGPRARGRL